MIVITVARRPLEAHTVASNVTLWGTGALNLDASRVPYEGAENGGRFPANLILQHSDGCTEGSCLIGCPVAELNKLGFRPSNFHKSDHLKSGIGYVFVHWGGERSRKEDHQWGSGGYASRLFKQVQHK